MDFQTTIKSPFTLSGPGLHTGKFIHATMRPAPQNTGILLRRIDLDPVVEMPAHAELVRDTNHGTTLGVGEATVSTIEHMMSALHGSCIDNAIIDFDGPEAPILDGSARLWVEKIMESGIETLQAERKFFRLTEDVCWSDPEAGIEMRAVPADDFQVVSEIQFKSQLIGSQLATLTSYNQFASEFARCRTFVFLHEVEVLLSHNLIKGGDLDNALVFVDKPLGDEEKERLAKLFNKDKDSIQVHDGVLNTVVPFYPNEPARHKLLDFVGDIYLVGCQVKAHFFLKCPGHRANVALAQEIRKILNSKI